MERIDGVLVLLQGGDDKVARGMTGSQIVCKVCVWESVVYWCRTKLSLVQGDTLKANHFMVRTRGGIKIMNCICTSLNSEFYSCHQIPDSKCNYGMERKEKERKEKKRRKRLAFGFGPRTSCVT